MQYALTFLSGGFLDRGGEFLPQLKFEFFTNSDFQKKMPQKIPVFVQIYQWFIFMNFAQVAELICALHMPLRKKEGKLLKWYMQDPAVQKRRENCFTAVCNDP